MGLDNYPIRPKWRSEEETKPVQTHQPDEPCPFVDLHQPVGMLGSCCWLRGKSAARELQAFGRNDLAERMHANIHPEDAAAIADELDAFADEFEKTHAGKDEKQRGAGWNGKWDEKAKAVVWETYSTFEEALSEIRLAAKWYRKVADLGYGVGAWY